jgi:outer membrane protein OmpA-like peptidoglycan-associated protein
VGDRVAVIHFRHGFHRLVDRDREVLRRVAGLYREKGGRLRVVGHASSRTATLDPIAHRMANLDISLKRAEAVADALAAMKVRRGDIRVEGRADREPDYHEFRPAGEAGNRRAEVYLAR